MDKKSLSRHVYSELFIMRCILLQLATFLEDENACKAAGYTSYSRYQWSSGKIDYDTIKIGYTDIDMLRFDFSYSLDPVFKEHRLYLKITGENFMNYTKRFINKFFRANLNYDYDMQQIERGNKIDLQILSIPMINPKYIPIRKHYKPSDVIKGMLLEIPDMSNSHIYLYPYVWVESRAFEIRHLKSLTKENLSYTQKFIKGIILGVNNASTISWLNSQTE